MKKLFKLFFAFVLAFICLSATCFAGVAQVNTVASSGGAWDFIVSHWAVIATALFAVSEILAFIPGVKSNGIFQMIQNLLKKSIPDADKKE